jgi:general secretion pathway protein A
MFLEGLDEHTEVAYIFNPKLDSLQLLKAINDEFYIPSDADSEKTLIDSFNTFLLRKKAQGRRVILLVDEAQNLSADVLEQLRLLSNLETNTSKLLQIILVGQPELGEMLATDGLRQLNQRITLSCRLIPLSGEETQEYIRHRLHIASHKPGATFSTAACRLIFKYTGGVPRLINIACDRALLIAFTLGQRRIGKAIVKRAIKELEGHQKRQRRTQRWPTVAIGLFATLVILGSAVLLTRTLVNNRADSVAPVAQRKIEAKPVEPDDPPPPPVSSTDAPTPAPDDDPIALPPPPAPLDTVLQNAVITALPEPDLPAGPSVVDLDQILAAMTDSVRSRSGALKAGLKAWDAPTPAYPGSMDKLESDIFFRLAARRSELEALRVKGNLNVIKKLNLPAIMEFVRPGDGDPRFLTVLELSPDRIRLADGESDFSVPPASLAGLWSGVAWILWKDFYQLEGVIPVSSPAEVILSLKIYLKSMGFPIAEMTPAYDDTTRAAVETIQARHGLDADGMVGPLTKIVLYNEDRSLDIPRLMPAFQGG